MTAADQERARADTASPPGNLRKVGPSLRRLAEKTGPEWTTQWVNAPREFRPETKMPHFYHLSTNSKENLPKDQENFPAAEVHAISHYLIAESKATLNGSDFYREALLKGKLNLNALQATLIKTGLSDRDMKDLLDVSRRFVDLAILSVPMHNQTINAHATRQRLLQERIAELQRVAARGGVGPEVKTEIDAAGKELVSLTDDLVKAAKPVSLADGLIDGHGEKVALPAADGNAGSGQRLFTEKGCLACHSHEGSTKAGTGPDGKSIPAVVSSANFGPELSRIADKLSPVADKVTARMWLVQWLLNPNVHHPRTKMPITHLSVAQANDVATWLLSQKTGWKGAPTDPVAPTVKDYKDLARVYLAKSPGMTRTDLDVFFPADGDVLAGISPERLDAMPRDADERILVKGKTTVDDPEVVHRQEGGRPARLLRLPRHPRLRDGQADRHRPERLGQEGPRPHRLRGRRELREGSLQHRPDPAHPRADVEKRMAALWHQGRAGLDDEKKEAADGLAEGPERHQQDHPRPGRRRQGQAGTAVVGRGKPRQGRFR